MKSYITPQEYTLRCAFPRGRLLTQVEDELTILTQLITQNTPNKKDKFDELIDQEYLKIRKASLKSIKNFRTEMSTLFGLTISDSNLNITPSPRTIELVDSGNFPFFFKSFCNKFQFPNCINKPQETKKQITAGVKFKPAKFILELFILGIQKCGESFSVNGNEVANLIFNDLRVTTGSFSASQVLDFLLELRKKNFSFVGGSKVAQHGREFLGYMLLARLLKASGRSFTLNTDEMATINYIINDNNFFDISADSISTVEKRKSTHEQWNMWYGSIDGPIETKLAQKDVVLTDVNVVKELRKYSTPKLDVLKDIGDRGERIVLKYEKEKIYNIRPDKVSLVKLVSSDTELGYDVQSLEFNDVSRKKYIEVKTTERTFPPSKEIITYFPMSGNEWQTAEHQGEHYYIYRVFLISDEIKIFVIKDPAGQHKKGEIILEALKYRVVIKNNAGYYISDL